MILANCSIMKTPPWPYSVLFEAVEKTLEYKFIEEDWTNVYYKTFRLKL
jgi:hypothetical protein